MSPQPNQAPGNQALAVVEPPRLPYQPRYEDDYGVSPQGWKALVEAVWPGAKSPAGVELALAYCKARNLDPMKKPVHIVPVWSSALGRMVEGVWPGISELRTTAMRTGLYAGCYKTAFGPIIEHTFSGGAKLAFPEWAQKTVLRLVGGRVVEFEGPEVHWLETYATAKRDTDAPNEMWRKRPRGQLDKCAEAAALRLAFPEEIGDVATAEEMTGKTIDFPGHPAEPPPRNVRVLHGGFEAPAPQAAPQAAQEPPETLEAEMVAPDPAPAAGEAPQGPQEAEGDAFDVVGWAVSLNRQVDGYSDVDVLRADWAEHKDGLKAANPTLFKQLNQNVAAHAQALSLKAAA